MNLTAEDKRRGWKEIRATMQDGRLEVVRVSAPQPAILAQAMGNKITAQAIYEFIAVVTGKPLGFTLRMDIKSFPEIFTTSCALAGLEHLMNQAVDTATAHLQVLKY